MGGFSRICLPTNKSDLIFCLNVTRKVALLSACYIFSIKASIFCFGPNAASSARAGLAVPAHVRMHARVQTGVNPSRARLNYSACVNKPGLSADLAASLPSVSASQRGSCGINHNKSLQHHAPTSTVHREATSRECRRHSPRLETVAKGQTCLQVVLLAELRLLSQPAGRLGVPRSSTEGDLRVRVFIILLLIDFDLSNRAENEPPSVSPSVIPVPVPVFMSRSFVSVSSAASAVARWNRYSHFSTKILLTPDQTVAVALGVAVSALLRSRVWILICSDFSRSTLARRKMPRFRAAVLAVQGQWAGPRVEAAVSVAAATSA